MTPNANASNDSEAVAQPSAKRARYAATEQDDATQSVPVELRDIPVGFVRDELDDDDPNEDPDFDGDVLSADDDDELYDSFDECNVDDLAISRVDAPLSTSLNDRHVDADCFLHADNLRQLPPDSLHEFAHPSRDLSQTPAANRRSVNRGVPAASEARTRPRRDEHAAAQKAPSVAAVPQRATSSGTHHSDAQPLRRQRRDDQYHFDVDKLDSSDDDEMVQASAFADNTLADAMVADFCEDDLDDGSVDDEDDVDVTEGSGDGDDADAGAQNDDEGDDYVRFLLGLVTDDNDANGACNAGAGAADAPDEGMKVVMDDDDDFDYLRECAKVRDDPLEFRDDLQVSRREVVQLLFNSEEKNLRRQTRTQKGRGNSHRTNAAAGASGANVGVVAEKNSVSALPHILPGAQIGADVTVPSYVGFAQASVVNLNEGVLQTFREQLAVHVHLIGSVHAEVMKRARGEADGEYRGAAQRSERLILRLIDNKRTSCMYHNMLQVGMGRLKEVGSKLLHKDRDGFNYETQRRSAYDLPVLDVLGQFVKDCKTMAVTELPGGAMKALDGLARADVKQALNMRTQRRQYTSSTLKKGWFAWTAEDDTLLAMTMAKYGREVGEYSKDLLPHRLEDDCQTRVKYLSSRRCADNAVKRQVMHISTPLNKEEVHLVRYGLERYGGGRADDAQVWKCIQRDLLPNREWSHLQKLWCWRESRRQYKAKYRAKMSERKKAMRNDSAKT